MTDRYSSKLNSRNKGIGYSVNFQMPLNRSFVLNLKTTGTYDETKNDYILNDFCPVNKNLGLWGAASLTYDIWNKLHATFSTGLDYLHNDKGAGVWNKVFRPRNRLRHAFEEREGIDRNRAAYRGE